MIQEDENKTSCIFCDIVAGKEVSYPVYEDDTCVCILDIHPYTKGHCLVIPKRHVTWWHEMTVEETENVFKAARTIANKMMTAFSSDFIFMYARGRRIPHAHIFLIPTYKDDLLDRFFHALEKFQESPKDLALLREKEQMLDAMRHLLKTDFSKEE